MRSEGVTFQIAKKPLSPTTKAACCDNKGQENANAQRSLLKATEINCFLFFFSFLKIPFKHATMKVTGDKRRKKISSLNIH